MKWFQHRATAHKNLKFRKLVKNFGWKGYGIYWICLELVAEQGKKFRIDAQKEWKNYLLDITSLEPQGLDELLQILAESDLISKNSLKKGHLYIPKLRDYCDDWTKRLQSSSIVPTEKLRPDKIRLDNTILNKSSDNSLNKLYKDAKRLISKEFPK